MTWRLSLATRKESKGRELGAVLPASSSDLLRPVPVWRLPPCSAFVSRPSAVRMSSTSLPAVSGCAIICHKSRLIVIGFRDSWPLQSFFGLTSHCPSDVGPSRALDYVQQQSCLTLQTIVAPPHPPTHTHTTCDNQRYLRRGQMCLGGGMRGCPASVRSHSGREGVPLSLLDFKIRKRKCGFSSSSRLARRSLQICSVSPVAFFILLFPRGIALVQK